MTKASKKNDKDEALDREIGGGGVISKIVRITALAAVAALFVALIVGSASKTKPTDRQAVWDEGTTLGASKDAKNHFIMWTDVMCPYCDAFTHPLLQNEEKIADYLKEKDIVLELRVTDFLYEHISSSNDYSRQSAIATSCAQREGKFWDYYKNAVNSLYDDYYSKGIGKTKTSTPITDITDEYWLTIGHEVGLGEKFDNCYNNKESLGDVEKTTLEASKEMSSKGASGLPFFESNGNNLNTGFDWSFGYDEVKSLFDYSLQVNERSS